MHWKVGDQRSFEHLFTQEQVEAYAKLVGDHNPMHVNAEFARKALGDEPVVHGMLAASLVSTLVGMHIPGPGALWQSFQVSWRQPIRSGDLIRFEAKVTSTHPSTQTMELEITGTNVATGAICLDGKGRVMTIEEEKAVEDKTSLVDKVVLVSGASGELGAAICRDLAANQVKTIALGRNENRLRGLQSELGESMVDVFACDLRDAAKLTEVLNKVVASHKVFGFVHVAAPSLSNLEVLDGQMLEALQEQWQVNVFAFQQIVSTLAKHMHDGGSIVHILTQYVFDTPPAKLAHYVSAKAAAHALVRSMALELGPKGIRCNSVSPGMMNTAYSKNVPLRIKQIEAASNPMRRLCAVEDVARTVTYLCGPGAAFVNGVNLPVTGGGRMP